MLRIHFTSAEWNMIRDISATCRSEFSSLTIPPSRPKPRSGNSGKRTTPPITSTGARRERARFPNLKPSTTAISIRLPLGLLEQIKIAANKRDVPYQSLIKMWLAEKVG